MTDLSFLSAIVFYLPDIASLISAVANVLSAIAWPILTGYVLIRFRRPIGRFIDRLKGVKVGGSHLDTVVQNPTEGPDVAPKSIESESHAAQSVKAKAPLETGTPNFDPVVAEIEKICSPRESLIRIESENTCYTAWRMRSSRAILREFRALSSLVN